MNLTRVTNCSLVLHPLNLKVRIPDSFEGRPLYDHMPLAKVRAQSHFQESRYVL